MSAKPALAALLLAAGCADEPAPPPPPETRREIPKPAAPEPAPVRKAEPASSESSDAADVLERYYALIEERRYAEAMKLRAPAKREPSLAAFAANFDRYARHRATIGVPSRPVAAGQWLYVEVPVQRYGVMKDGTPFANAGIMTLRRPRSGASGWRLYTRG